MQKRRNSIVNTLELRLFCIKPSIYSTDVYNYGSHDVWNMVLCKCSPLQIVLY